MTDIEIPFGADAQETATLLLAAAEDLGLDPAVAVRTTEGNFLVSQEVADKASLSSEDEEAEADEKPKPAKKAAKKTAAKKTAAKTKE